MSLLELLTGTWLWGLFIGTWMTQKASVSPESSPSLVTAHESCTTGAPWPICNIFTEGHLPISVFVGQCPVSLRYLESATYLLPLSTTLWEPLLLFSALAQLRFNDFESHRVHSQALGEATWDLWKGTYESCNFLKFLTHESLINLLGLLGLPLLPLRGNISTQMP